MRNTMINSDPHSIDFLKRIRIYKAGVALFIALGFGAMAVIAPPASSDSTTRAASASKSVPAEPLRHDSNFGTGASFDALTNGVDMHG
jgi:hypothetical protein